MDQATPAIPIIRLRETLIVPLQGMVTDRQAAELNANILERIARGGVRGVVLEISGVALLDSHLCALIGQLAQSAALMGAQMVACGLNANVVLTLIAMGLELDVLRTALTLEAALGELGIFIVERSELEEGAPDAGGADPSEDRDEDLE